jgi:nucleotide-binding universal stress UspA family protein
MLLVPPGVDQLLAQNIVVCWSDSREARRAVADSLPFLKQAKDVSVISIATDERGAKDVSAYLRGHGVASSSYVRPITRGSSAADELVQVARQQGADLFVCGAYGHSRAREWAFGGVTRDLLDHSPLCCLMSH